MQVFDEKYKYKEFIEEYLTDNIKDRESLRKTGKNQANIDHKRQ